MRPHTTSARKGVKGPVARFQACPGPVTLSPSRSPGTAAPELGGDRRPPPRGQAGRRFKAEQEVVGDALQAPREVSQEHDGGKDMWHRARAEGTRTGHPLGNLLCTRSHQQARQVEKDL